MKELLSEIRHQLTGNDYQNEEQVRLSLVARICQSLGWNIWDPDEFYTEYSVKKFPTNESANENGMVDIALFISKRNDRTPEVYIETKAPGKLLGNFESFENQLSRYNHYDKSAISILTDGAIWKFYLPSAGGTFSQRLFIELNFLKDDISFIEQVMNQVLRKDNFRKNAVKASEYMLEEQKVISEIATVKDEAELLASSLGDSKYEIAQKLIRRKFGRDLNQDEIEKYWDRKKQYLDSFHSDDNLGLHKVPPTQLTAFDPTGKKPKRVFVIDKWHEVNSWRKIYVIVCEELIKRHPDTNLCGFLSKHNKWSEKTNVMLTTNNKYLMINWSAKNCIKYSIRFLSSHGYKPDQRLKIEFSE